MTPKLPAEATEKDERWIDPEMTPALERMKARMASRAPMTAVPIEVMRERARGDFAALNQFRPEIALVEETRASGAFGLRPVRIYDAHGERKGAPGLVYFHGGGWIVGDLDSEDAKLRRLAIESGVRIVSVDYSLAPERKFPGPLDDCVALARSIHAHAADYGLDPSRLGIGGASAGANLALAAALALKDSGETWLRCMVLFYGVFDLASDAPSRSLFTDGYGMSADAMEFFYSLYLNSPEEKADRRASPLLDDLGGLPPAYISAAGLDVLRDDSRALAEGLRCAGISVEYDEAPGVIHGFTLLAHEVGAARKTIAAAGHALRSALD